MLETLNHLVAGGMDYVLGWLLYLPRDAVLIALALTTSSILTFVRLFSTNQEWLGRAAADKARLKELTAEAKAEYKRSRTLNIMPAPAATPDATNVMDYRGSDVAATDTRKAARLRWKDAKNRYKATTQLIQVKSMKSEFLPLLCALIPIFLLATWAFARVNYVPPRVGDDVTLRMVTPTSAIGRLAYLAPQDGVVATGGWIQKVDLDTYLPSRNWWDKGEHALRAGLRGVYNLFTVVVKKVTFGHVPLGELSEAKPEARGVAVWHVKTTRPGSYSLKVRFGGTTFEKDLIAGTNYYAEPVKKFDTGNVQALELGMHEFRLFGSIGGLLGLEPWLVGYLLIAVPFVFILRRIFNIH